jgi:hypothetical protein
MCSGRGILRYELVFFVSFSCILPSAYTLAVSIIGVGAINGVTLVLILPLALAVGALVSNIKSLQN